MDPRSINLPDGTHQNARKDRKSRKPNIRTTRKTAEDIVEDEKRRKAREAKASQKYRLKQKLKNQLQQQQQQQQQQQPVGHHLQGADLQEHLPHAYQNYQPVAPQFNAPAQPPQINVQQPQPMDENYWGPNNSPVPNQNVGNFENVGAPNIGFDDQPAIPWAPLADLFLPSNSDFGINPSYPGTPISDNEVPAAPNAGDFGVPNNGFDPLPAPMVPLPANGVPVQANVDAAADYQDLDIDQFLADVGIDFNSGAPEVNNAVDPAPILNPSLLLRGTLSNHHFDDWEQFDRDYPLLRNLDDAEFDRLCSFTTEDIFAQT